MRSTVRCIVAAMCLAVCSPACLAQAGGKKQVLKINAEGYYETPGMNVILFDDFYPDGHQGGLTIVQAGTRIAANGDLRLEPTPGQWSPVPAIGARTVDRKKGTISVTLWYPDSSKDRKQQRMVRAALNNHGRCIQVSQVGYHPEQSKFAVIETDKRTRMFAPIRLVKVNGSSETVVKTEAAPVPWGKFLRYTYLRFDFTDVRESGLYKITYGGVESNEFEIKRDICADHVWQPTICSSLSQYTHLGEASTITDNLVYNANATDPVLHRALPNERRLLRRQYRAHERGAGPCHAQTERRRIHRTDGGGGETDI